MASTCRDCPSTYVTIACSMICALGRSSKAASLSNLRAISSSKRTEISLVIAPPSARKARNASYRGGRDGGRMWRPPPVATRARFVGGLPRRAAGDLARERHRQRLLIPFHIHADNALNADVEPGLLAHLPDRGQ